MQDLFLNIQSYPRSHAIQVGIEELTQDHRWHPAELLAEEVAEEYAPVPYAQVKIKSVRNLINLAVKQGYLERKQKGRTVYVRRAD